MRFSQITIFSIKFVPFQILQKYKQGTLNALLHLLDSKIAVHFSFTLISSNVFRSCDIVTPLSTISSTICSSISKNQCMDKTSGNKHNFLLTEVNLCNS